MGDEKTVIIKGKQLVCPVCGNNLFFEFDVRLNTLATTFFSGVWSFLAKKAKAYVCSNCGSKQEFCQLS